ncbi:hypothetical protein C8A05DRAFT_19335 [Staphylotrichum tortipilum]|uniref:Uncharacterized protein n=1 Tax=Staphylotrichum tortipilum TaxID=2831512 RepID=A0AAN6MBU6_9PEZI|nr:hypothetical protein C8A05DRAFT_19335 [Staphylotrichum longicolle]
MFGSRSHRPPNPPLTAATANPNATTAAAAVFKRHDPNANASSLSAAAAAAALRARPTTPICVADVQTKRTKRRSASSLTAGLPPVPALPRNMDAASRSPASDAQPLPRHRKASSLAMAGPHVALASQKLASGDAPSWFGPAKIGDLDSIRRLDPAMASPPSSPMQAQPREEDIMEGVRPGSQASSINFSYPTRARRGSANLAPVADASAAVQPLTQPFVEDHQPAQSPWARRQRGQGPPVSKRQSAPSSPEQQAMVYDPNSRRMVRQVDVLALQHVRIQQVVAAAPQRPTGPKKKKKTHQRTASHLAMQTTGQAQSDVAYAPPLVKPALPSSSAHAQPERPATKPTTAPDLAPVLEARANDEQPPVAAIISSPRSAPMSPEQQPPAQRAAGPPGISTLVGASSAAQAAMRSQAPMVREERELQNAQEERGIPAGAISKAHPTPTLPLPIITMPSADFSENHVAAPVEYRPQPRPVDVPDDRKPKPGATERWRSEHATSDRTHSNSPARQAHFGPIRDSLTVKHSPPPRSISPRKSALKHASPPRGASPTGDTSEGSGSVVQEPIVTRKKSVRVSFDDGGSNWSAAAEPASPYRSDSPMAVSPPHATRHSWLPNLGRSQDSPWLDDDVVMKPRPALPSFGSVRDRKPRDAASSLSERPLVRPKGETRYPSTLLPSPPLGSSNDHALGAVLSSKHGKRTVDAPAPGEPLPPVVTTVEGSGYFSDSSDTSSILNSEFEQSEPSLPATVPESHPGVSAVAQATLPKAAANGSAISSREPFSSPATEDREMPLEQQIPAISVSQPTPVNQSFKQHEQSERPSMDVPGGFPEDESDQSAELAPEPAPVKDATQPAVVGQGSQSVEPAGQTTPSMTADSSSDSDSDVFSDAYEDLSEIEGDGFQSLDAVVESPLQQSPRQAIRSEQSSKEIAATKPLIEAPVLQTEISSVTTAVETPPLESPHDEWEKAKAYWRSLSAEKRAQLEREATEEASAEASREAKPETKQKQKSAEVMRAAHVAQPRRAKEPREETVNPDRVYMIQPGEQWAKGESSIPRMRTTMRDGPQQAEGSLLRKSMRPAGPGTTASASRAPSGRAASKRPVSSPPVPVMSTAVGQRGLTTQAEPLPGNSIDTQVQLKRRGSTGSESSFKRARAARPQGFGFHHSLRPTSPPSTQGDTRASKRLSLRTLSSAGSVSTQDPDSPPSRASANTHMRTTMREPSGGKKSSGGLHMPSFSALSYGGGKKHGSKASKTRAGGSRVSSRFGDSSDDEAIGGYSSDFQSRFEDSSDDEPVMPVPMPMPLPRPASASAQYAAPRGAAHHFRNEGSIASTALPEELEESEGSPDRGGTAAGAAIAEPPAVNTALRRSRSGRGQLAGSQPVAADSQAADSNEGHVPRRNSILSVLRHRRKDSKKIGRPDVSESAARRDTKLERSVGQLERIRSHDEGEREGDEVAPLPRSPRLQKRASKRASAPGMVMTPPSIPSAETGHGISAVGISEEDQDGFNPEQIKRSNTSGNLGTRTLSGTFLGLQPHRRAASVGMPAPPSVDGSVAGSLAGASSTTRKKRFGALRKIFGLHE